MNAAFWSDGLSWNTSPMRTWMLWTIPTHTVVLSSPFQKQAGRRLCGIAKCLRFSASLFIPPPPNGENWFHTLSFILGKNNWVPNLLQRMLLLSYDSFTVTVGSLDLKGSHVWRKDLKQALLKEFYTQNNKVLLYSTRDYIQYLIITYIGKESEKEYINIYEYIYIYMNHFGVHM